MTDPQVLNPEADEDTDPMLDFLKPFFAKCERNFKDYRSLEAQVAAAEGDRDAAVRAWMDNSSDEEAKAIRDAIERATNKLRTLAEAAVGDTKVSDEEKARLKVQLEAAAKKAKASSRGLRGLAEPFDLDVTPKLRSLGDPFLPAEKTGTGSTLPRTSVYVQTIRNGDPKRSMTFENMSGAAKHIDLPIEELGKLYAQAAGVPYEDISKVKEQLEFTYQNDQLKDAPVWTIKTTPKESARGRQAVETPTTEQPQETVEDVA
jgi:flavin-binding protein dodecin